MARVLLKQPAQPQRMEQCGPSWTRTSGRPPSPATQWLDPIPHLQFSPLGLGFCLALSGSLPTAHQPRLSLCSPVDQPPSLHSALSTEQSPALRTGGGMSPAGTRPGLTYRPLSTSQLCTYSLRTLAMLSPLPRLRLLICKIGICPGWSYSSSSLLLRFGLKATSSDRCSLIPFTK